MLSAYYVLLILGVILQNFGGNLYGRSCQIICSKSTAFLVLLWMQCTQSKPRKAVDSDFRAGGLAYHFVCDSYDIDEPSLFSAKKQHFPCTCMYLQGGLNLARQLIKKNLLALFSCV